VPGAVGGEVDRIAVNRDRAEGHQASSWRLDAKTRQAERIPFAQADKAKLLGRIHREWRRLIGLWHIALMREDSRVWRHCEDR
jgi:hypothetical protein